MHTLPRQTRIVLSALLLLAALLSVVVAGPRLSDPDTHAEVIRSLDNKKATVTELLAASTSASALITLIPDDAGTPIAEELADLSVCFLAVLGTLYLEKYLLPILGGLSFYVLLPLTCALLILYLLERKKHGAVRRAALRLLAFALAAFLVIPISVWVSDRIETTWQASIQTTLETAAQDQTIMETAADEEKGLLGHLRDAAGNLVSGAADAINWARNVLNHFVEAVAILLVTDCVIPILVLLLFSRLIRYLFSAALTRDLPALPAPRARTDAESEDAASN